MLFFMRLCLFFNYFILSFMLSCLLPCSHTGQYVCMPTIVAVLMCGNRQPGHQGQEVQEAWLGGKKKGMKGGKKGKQSKSDPEDSSSAGDRDGDDNDGGYNGGGGDNGNGGDGDKKVLRLVVLLLNHRCWLMCCWLMSSFGS